jgi:sterol desaturase/sphingolipid hydroxylase (fatty acid hydroxylase superfamily)
MAPFSPVSGLVAFAVNLLIGGAALHLAARYVVFRDRPGALTYEHAIVTALLGAVVWALLSWIPVVGVLLALLGWIAVIQWRYPGGLWDAVKLGLAAWVAAVVILAVLELLGVRALSALGVPGT